MIYQTDNLPFMEKLKSESINLIYGDVLYGTGRKFKNDFQDIKADRQTVYNFYTPRIEQMYRILHSTGTLILQADYRIIHWLRDIADNYFTLQNEIIWYYNSAPRKKGCFGNRHDTLLRYTKTDTFTFNAEHARQPYSPTAPRGYEKETYYNPKGKIMDDVWTIPMLGQNDKTERTGYSTQKPLALTDRIVKIMSNTNDLCFDPFCGAGTFCLSAKNLGRQYLGTDISPNAIKVCKQRGLETYDNNQYIMSS